MMHDRPGAVVIGNWFSTTCQHYALATFELVDRLAALLRSLPRSNAPCDRTTDRRDPQQ
jgi:hypothetical protein